jgi:uncharacterized protein YndB with AHSA1/START domain
MIDAPVETIWELVGNPVRHPEWWPRVIQVSGERYEPGDQYVQVTRGPLGSGETNFLVQRKDDLREIRLSCMLTGTYAHWHLTEAQGGTFVDLEMGMEPKRFGDKVFDTTFGPRFFRRWADESLDAIGDVAGATDEAGVSLPPRPAGS